MDVSSESESETESSSETESNSTEDGKFCHIVTIKRINFIEITFHHKLACYNYYLISIILCLFNNVALHLTIIKRYYSFLFIFYTFFFVFSCN